MTETSDSIKSSDRQSILAGKITEGMWIRTTDHSVHEVTHVVPYYHATAQETYVLIVGQAGFRMDRAIGDSVQLANDFDISKARTEILRMNVVSGLRALTSIMSDRVIPSYPITIHIDVDDQDHIDQVARRLNLDIIDTWRFYETTWQHPSATSADVMVTWSYDKDTHATLMSASTDKDDTNVEC